MSLLSLPRCTNGNVATFDQILLIYCVIIHYTVHSIFGQAKDIVIANVSFTWFTQQLDFCEANYANVSSKGVTDATKLLA